MGTDSAKEAEKYPLRWPRKPSLGSSASLLFPFHLLSHSQVSCHCPWASWLSCSSSETVMFLSGGLSSGHALCLLCLSQELSTCSLPHPGFCWLPVTSPEKPSLPILSASFCFLYFPSFQSTYHHTAQWSVFTGVLIVCFPSGMRAPMGRAVSGLLTAVPAQRVCLVHQP